MVKVNVLVLAILIEGQADVSILPTGYRPAAIDEAAGLLALFVLEH
jgi:hypothetical protein